MKHMGWICGYLALPLVSVFLSIGLAGESARQAAQEVYDTLLAPCCWHESLAVHRSETATTLRAEIASMAEAGMSAQQIRDKMTQRYGVRILREPPGERARWLYTLPVISVLLGLMALVWFVKRRTQREARPVALPEGVTLPDVDLD